MKHYIKPTFVLAGALLAASSFLNAGASAPTPVATAPVGYVTTDLPVGRSLYSPPMVQADAFNGVVSGVSGSTLTFDSLPALPTPAYVQVLDETGSATGIVSTVVSSTATTVTLEAAIAGLVADTSRVAIRKHITIGDIFEGATIADATTVDLYEGNGDVTALTYFAGFGFFDQDNNPADNIIVQPGEGMVVNNAGATPISVTLAGSVLTKQAKRDIYPSVVNIVSPLDPSGGSTLIDLIPSPADASTATAYTNTGGVFSASGNYTFFAGFGWYDEGNNLANSIVIQPGSAIVVKSSAASVATVNPNSNI